MFVVPVFTLILGAPSALVASALLDAVAGLLLLPQVHRHIDWGFVLPVIGAISVGSFIGARMVFLFSPILLKRLIGGMLLLFVSYLLWNPAQTPPPRKQPATSLKLLIALISGISGGLVGMSGPPLAAFLKYFSGKEYFRTQLVIIFFVEKIVRLGVYAQGNLLPLHHWPAYGKWIPVLILGLVLGSRVHTSLSETRFNRVVGLLLLIPAFRLLLF